MINTLPISNSEIALKAKEWSKDRVLHEKMAKAMNNDVVDVFGLKIHKGALEHAGFLKDGKFDYSKLD